MLIATDSKCISVLQTAWGCQTPEAKSQEALVSRWVDSSLCFMYTMDNVDNVVIQGIVRKLNDGVLNYIYVKYIMFAQVMWWSSPRTSWATATCCSLQSLQSTDYVLQRWASYEWRAWFNLVFQVRHNRRQLPVWRVRHKKTDVWGDAQLTANTFLCCAKLLWCARLCIAMLC